jgi:phage shock protein PspC (stress-responsive transcriptional regulator)
MICSNCQREIADYSNFCYFCGMRQHVSTGCPSHAPKRLTKSRTDRKLAGVCGGIAEYCGIDSTILRVIWVLAVILPIPLVPATLAYIIAWIAMPQAPIYCQVQPPSAVPNSTQTA